MKNLTVEQFNLLFRIADYHKLDWFVLKHDDENDADYVYDFENDEILSLKDGIIMLNECLDFDLYKDNLSEDEVNMYHEIIKKAMGQ